MDEGFSSPTNIQWQGHTGVVEYGNDRNMVAMFYYRPVHMPGKSAELGRPYYEDQIFVRIHPPGERLNIVDRPVKETDKRRWPMQWAQFQQNKEQVHSGTPIDLLYTERPSIGAALRANAVFTIEQCAELSGPAIDSIGMGAQQYQNDAKKYLEMANKGMAATQVRAELEERDRQLRVQQRQIDAMQAELQTLRAQSANNADLGNLQQLLASALGRPQFPAGQKQMPASFDAATAQINATHGTAMATERQIHRAPRQRSRIAK